MAAMNWPSRRRRSSTGVDITDYMEIDMKAFKALTDAVGGVYVDVDKHYLQTDWHYEMIDQLPGYQLLNGAQALDYVRYRKDNNMDFGRQQRQQRYLAGLREQAMSWDLGVKLPGIIKAMTDNIKTSIEFDEIQSLAYWAVTKLGGGQIRQIAVVGPIQEIDGESFVIADEAVLRKKIPTLPPHRLPGRGDHGSHRVTRRSPRSGHADRSCCAHRRRFWDSVDSSQFITNPDSIADAAMWKQIAAQTPFKVMAPGYLPAEYVYFDRNPEGGGGYAITGDEEGPQDRLQAAAGEHRPVPGHHGDRLAGGSRGLSGPAGGVQRHYLHGGGYLRPD